MWTIIINLFTALLFLFFGGYFLYFFYHNKSEQEPMRQYAKEHKYSIGSFKGFWYNNKFNIIIFLGYLFIIIGLTFVFITIGLIV